MAIYGYFVYMGVSKNRGTPKSSILIGISLINHPFWGTIIFGNTHIYIYVKISAGILRSAPRLRFLHGFEAAMNLGSKAGWWLNQHI